ncbi:ribonuclease H-like domain-containing protein [Tanacetum coccineum]
MVTRFRVGSNHPPERLNLHVSSISPLPKSYTDAFNDLNWQNVMQDEYNALIKNNTWTLVPRPMDANIVCCMWLFRHKYLADDTLSRYKACLVANGSTHIDSVDVDETFSLEVSLWSEAGLSGLVSAFSAYIIQRWLDVKHLFEYWIKSLDSNRKPNKPDVHLYNLYLRANLMLGVSAGELLDLVEQMED